MGPRTDSSCCCQARNLSWAPVPPPHAAARSRVCHGSLYGLPLLLSPSPHSAMCHFQVSSHCWWVPFCHRGAVWPPIAAASTATLWHHTLVLAPVTAQMSEVCGDSKIDGTHLHVILTDSIISLPQQNSKGI
ncbi:unnamed protein product [Staurois parvus]|uniref:Uncharacterized protein n=1 Tax=Staurois parvus TaxID=386267 RepID=A0ABN9AAY9_9NEOB|nr:unnamed protein product [Staurois parvus]